MQILAYCVLAGTLVFLGLNGGEDAGATTWALSLCGILTALVLMVKGQSNADTESEKSHILLHRPAVVREDRRETSRHAAPQGDEQTR